MIQPLKRLNERIPLRLLLAISMLVVVFLLVPISEVAEAMQKAEPAWILLGLALQVTVRIFTAARATVLARFHGLPVSFRQLLHIQFTSAFYALLLPGALLGSAATYMKYLQQGAPAGPSLGNVVVNKGLELLGILCMAGVALLYIGLGPWGGILGAALLVVWLLVYREFALLFGMTRYLSNKAQDAESAWLQKLGVLLQHLNVFEGMSRQQCALVLAIAVATQFLAIVVIQCYAQALGITLPFEHLVWIYAVLCFLAVVPITVANAGVRESATIVLLKPFAIAAPLALAWSLCMYLESFLSAAIGGLIEARSGLTKPKKKAEPSKQQQ